MLRSKGMLTMLKFYIKQKFRKAWKCILYNTAQFLYTFFKTRPKDSKDIVLIRLKTDSNLLCLISCSCAIWNKVGWWGSRIGCLIINFLKQKSIATVKKETINRLQKKFSFSALCFIWMFKHFQGKHIILKHAKKQKTGLKNINCKNVVTTRQDFCFCFSGLLLLWLLFN